MILAKLLESLDRTAALQLQTKLLDALSDDGWDFQLDKDWILLASNEKIPNQAKVSCALSNTHFGINSESRVRFVNSLFKERGVPLVSVVLQSGVPKTPNSFFAILQFESVNDAFKGSLVFEQILWDAKPSDLNRENILYMNESDDTLGNVVGFLKAVKPV